MPRVHQSPQWDLDTLGYPLHGLSNISQYLQHLSHDELSMQPFPSHSRSVLATSTSTTRNVLATSKAWFPLSQHPSVHPPPHQDLKRFFDHVNGPMGVRFHENRTVSILPETTLPRHLCAWHTKNQDRPVTSKLPQTGYPTERRHKMPLIIRLRAEFGRVEFRPAHLIDPNQADHSPSSCAPCYASGPAHSGLCRDECAYLLLEASHRARHRTYQFRPG